MNKFHEFPEQPSYVEQTLRRRKIQRAWYISVGFAHAYYDFRSVIQTGFCVVQSTCI